MSRATLALPSTAAPRARARVSPSAGGTALALRAPPPAPRARLGRMHGASRFTVCSGDGMSEEDEAYAQSIVGGGLAKEASDLAMKMLEDDPEVKQQLANVGSQAKAVAAKMAAKEEIERQIKALEASGAAGQVAEEQQVKEAAADAALLASARAAKAAADDVLEAEAAIAALREKMGGGSPAGKWSSEGINDDAERIETGKAGAVAGLGGTVGAIPFAVGGGGFYPLLAAAGSAFLFGVTYRYALRKDIGNTQLKGGVVAAFGLVRAIGAAETVLDKAGGALSVDVLGESFLRAGESMLIFGFAAAALEAAFRAGVLKTFPASDD